MHDVVYATLATVDDAGNPWNSPVYYAFDDNLHMYWTSNPSSVHSRNIQKNGKVFIVVYNSKAPAGEGQGGYLQCTAQALTMDEEIRTGLLLLGARRGKPFEQIDKFKAAGPQRVFKATPLRCWINDADQDADGDFIRDYLVEVDSKSAK